MRNPNPTAKYRENLASATPCKDAIPLHELLARLGYSGAIAQQVARTAMEETGLTNPRKKGVHPRKYHAVNAMLGKRFSRTCGWARCADLSSPAKRLVLVDPPDCEICGGRPTRRAAKTMAAALSSAGVRRMVVAGGGPGSQEELKAALTESSVQLDFIDGARAPNTARARELGRNADVIVIWAGTILPHCVSAPLVHPGLRSKTVTVTRRGIEAFADVVIEYCERRRRPLVSSRPLGLTLRSAG